MNRLERHLRWVTSGYRYFSDNLARIGDSDIARSSALPDWTRKHVVAHVGFNARALRRLVRWAATGVPTPMYPNSTARASEIGEGAGWDGPRLRTFLDAEQNELASALCRLGDEGWSAEVVTGQGRTVVASEIPWLRIRELWIHAVDLDAGGDYTDFPSELIDELLIDALAKRRSTGTPTLTIRPTDRLSFPHSEGPFSGPIEGSASDLARWLTGRGSRDIRTTDGSPLPELGPWL